MTPAPGRRALALLAVAETALLTGSSCSPAAARWLKVYPPHLRDAVYVPVRAMTCSSPPDRVLEISPVYPDT